MQAHVQMRRAALARTIAALTLTIGTLALAIGALALTTVIHEGRGAFRER